MATIIYNIHWAAGVYCIIWRPWIITISLGIKITFQKCILFLSASTFYISTMWQTCSDEFSHIPSSDELYNLLYNLWPETFSRSITYKNNSLSQTLVLIGWQNKTLWEVAVLQLKPPFINVLKLISPPLSCIGVFFWKKAQTWTNSQNTNFLISFFLMHAAISLFLIAIFSFLQLFWGM